ncbi:hypothetical protein ABFY27_02450 [Akkermansia massiliensis]
MAEGSNIEADVITASTYYLESAQQGHRMFAPSPSRFMPWKRRPVSARPSRRRKGPFSSIRGRFRRTAFRGPQP